MSVTVMVWVTETGWMACVDAARAWLPGHTVSNSGATGDGEGEPGASDDSDTEIVLLYVADDDVPAVAHGAFAGLLGRRRFRDRDPGEQVAALLDETADQLLSTAAERLGRPARILKRHGRVEHEVAIAAADADLLICARDGEPKRVGPHSLGRQGRFVVDHAACPVLLVWPLGPPPPRIPPPPGPSSGSGQPPPHEHGHRHHPPEPPAPA